MLTLMDVRLLNARLARVRRFLTGLEPQRDWRDMARVTPRGWADRAAFAAEKLGPVSGVADMGCGMMALEKYLAPGTRYVPIDLYARDARTIVCDFDHESPPKTGMPAVACLGLLSHLQRPGPFMASMACEYDRAVVSYPAIDAPGASSNLRRPINPYTGRDAEQMLTDAGWRIEARYERPCETLWVLSHP